MMTSTATAIICGAALLNAVELVDKDIGKVKIVVNGAGRPASPVRSISSF